jgi:hypothetical protein
MPEATRETGRLVVGFLRQFAEQPLKITIEPVQELVHVNNIACANDRAGDHG